MNRVFNIDPDACKFTDKGERTSLKMEDSLPTWDDLPVLSVDPKELSKKRIVAHDSHRLDSEVFAVLRTKVMLEIQKHGWKRVAITSPTRGCGKSFVSANLAISMSHHPDLRTVLLDMDLREPSLNNYFGIETRHAISDALTGKAKFHETLYRIGPRLAVGVGVNSVPNSGVILNSRATGEVINSIEECFKPDLILFDTPPINFLEDTLSLFSHTDAVILLLGGGITTQEETETARNLIEEHSNLLGVVLNKSRDGDASKYRY